MAEMARGLVKSESSSGSGEAGARIAPDAIDPDLIKLPRPRPKVGMITAAGIVLLSVSFFIRLAPDREFAGQPSVPQAVAVSEILAGNVEVDQYVSFESAPLMTHAIRAIKTRGDLGLRVTPVRGASNRLWIVLAGDGWDQPTPTNRYKGRLRRLSELPVADAVRAYSAEAARPVFATPAAVRAAMAGGPLTTVAGDAVTVASGDRVAFDLLDPAKAVVIASFNDRLPTAQAWLSALTAAGLTPTLAQAGPSDETLGQARFEVATSFADATRRLELAQLWAVRVESVTRHLTTTWGELARSAAAGFVAEGTTVPDAQIDLLGVYIVRPIPDDAYALLTTELPQDYWYVTPITIALGFIGLLFAWALVRAVRRDLLPTRV